MTIKKPTTNAIILLVDNGSTRADAAVKLRSLAADLSLKTNTKVHAVSLKHSNHIKADDVKNKLGGIPANVFSTFMTEQLSAGHREFILIPLFFGKSRALTSFVPDEKSKLVTQFGPFKLSITEVLYPLPDGESQLVDILYEHALYANGTDTKEALQNVVLVDHGSPLPAVNAVRKHIASALNVKLPDDIEIAQAAMERRSGKEYDFNGELLADYLNRIAKSGEAHATVLLLFLLAGTHAGEGGDIVQICNAVTEEYPNLTISISPLISDNETLVSVLEKRLNTHLN